MLLVSGRHGASGDGLCRVESGAVVLDLVVVGSGPVDQSGDGDEQGGAQISQCIHHPWGHLGIGGSGDETVTPQLVEGVGEHSLGETRDGVKQVGVAQGPALKRTDHEHGPLVARPLDDLPDGFPVFRRPAGTRPGQCPSLPDARVGFHGAPALPVTHTRVPFVSNSIPFHYGVTHHV